MISPLLPEIHTKLLGGWFESHPERGGSFLSTYHCCLCQEPMFVAFCCFLQAGKKLMAKVMLQQIMGNLNLSRLALQSQSARHFVIFGTENHHRDPLWNNLFITSLAHPNYTWSQLGSKAIFPFSGWKVQPRWQVGISRFVKKNQGTLPLIYEGHEKFTAFDLLEIVGKTEMCFF